jgi:hypothetical protein
MVSPNYVPNELYVPKFPVNRDLEKHIENPLAFAQLDLCKPVQIAEVEP